MSGWNGELRLPGALVGRPCRAWRASQAQIHHPFNTDLATPITRVHTAMLVAVPVTAWLQFHWQAPTLSLSYLSTRYLATPSHEAQGAP